MSRSWTQEEDQYMLLNLDKFEIPFLATVLERTPSAVTDHIRQYRKSQIEIQPELEFFLARASALNVPPVLTKVKGTVLTSHRIKANKGNSGSAWQFTNTGWRADIEINARSNW